MESTFTRGASAGDLRDFARSKGLAAYLGANAPKALKPEVYGTATERLVLRSVGAELAAEKAAADKAAAEKAAVPTALLLLSEIPGAVTDSSAAVRPPLLLRQRSSSRMTMRRRRTPCRSWRWCRPTGPRS